MAEGKLTIKQEKFCNKYLECGNASEAYRFAYDCSKMSDDTVRNNAYMLLQNSEITARVKELQRGYNEGKTTPSKDNFCTSLRARARGNRTHETLLQVYIMNFPTSMRARAR